MLQSIIIGRVGATAETKNVNGKEFTTFRVAHTDKWTDEKGQQHEVTTWVDCVINGRTPVCDYLVTGAQVYVCGNAQLRIYSSPKDRCMKAGLTISVKTIELVGGKPDDVPAKLFRADGGEQVDVRKLYHASSLVRDDNSDEYVALVSSAAKQFVADRQGWVYPFKEQEQ